MEAQIIMPKGMMGPDKDYLVDAIIRAIAEHYADEGDWAEKYGTDIDTETFTMKRYCWCEREDCPYCWDEEEYGPRKPNFHYKPTDFSVEWYKYIGRGMYMNRQISIEECSRILSDCLDPQKNRIISE